MKNSFRILSIVFVLGLLLAGIGTAVAKQLDMSDLGQLNNSHAPQAVTVAEDDVQISDSTGNSVSWVKPNSTSTFFIMDGALGQTKGATSTWVGFSGSQGATGNTFNLADGTVNGSTTTSFSVGATDYSTSNSTSTPLKAFPTAKIGGLLALTTSASLNHGTFTLATAAADGAGTTVTTVFDYHLVDTYAATATAGRAKVTSTSDPAGEYVTITEVTAVGATTTSPTSTIFRGDVELSSDAAKQGTNGDGVWVSDGDTLTVTYLDASGTSIDTDTVTVDGVAPTVSSISPADGTITNLTNPVVSFQATDTGSGITAVNPGTVITISILPVSTSSNTTSIISSGVPAFAAIADGFSVTYADQTSWLTQHSGAGVANNVAFQWQIEATDVAGNTKTVTGSALDLKIDTSKPTVSSAVTGTGWDSVNAVETTGQTTAVKVTLSEDVDASTVAVADFTVAGVQPSAVVVGTTAGLKGTVYLTVSAQAPDARPEAKVVSEVKDLAGNILDISASTAKYTATDGLKATATITVGAALAAKDGAFKVTVATDEKLTVDAGLIVSINGPEGATGNGKLTTTSPIPQTSEGTFTVAAGTATGQYGVSVQVKDLAVVNVTNNLTKVTDETVAAANKSTNGKTITLATGPIADTDFDGDVDKDDLTVTIDGTATTSITSVNASARTFVVAGDTTSAVVKVTYHTPTDIFEVDQTAPTATFDPADAASIENHSPFVRIIFDEDEYPGDSYKTVTLTKAELTKPDATTEDLLASFVSTDNIEYLWAGSNLALGKYTLKVSGMDTSGNILTDKTSTFTVAARALYSLSLRPGWNLVSLPGVPADSTINTVITVAAVDVVLSYDPTMPGGWMTAVRDANGDLSGTLSMIDESKAYWVHTTTFDPIKVDIPGLTAGSAMLPPSFALVKGWNLVPVSTLDLTDTVVDPDEYFSGLTWSRVYGYDNVTNKFTGIIPSESGDPDLSIGKGYWVFLTAAGTLVP